MHPLRLTPHTFACLSGTQVVLLDLRNDQYETVAATETAPLAKLIPGWPFDDTTDEIVGIDHPDVRLMLEKGWITTDARNGKDATPVRVEPAMRSIAPTPPLSEAERTRYGWRLPACVPFFYLAVWTAWLALKFLPIRFVVRFVSWRQPRRPFNCHRAQRYVGIYHELRTVAFSAQDECLFDSLSLKLFLWFLFLRPRWVFGVATAPFAAHCWLQASDVVCNDDAENVRRFTPIMCV